jgi:hypothetical protein
MELLIFVVALSVLAGLAMRFGFDSRETPDAKEETWVVTIDGR